MSVLLSRGILRTMCSRFCRNRLLWDVSPRRDMSFLHLLSNAQDKTRMTHMSVRFFSEVIEEAKGRVSSTHSTDGTFQKSPFIDLESCGSPSAVLDLTCWSSLTNPNDVGRSLIQMRATIKCIPVEQRQDQLQLMFAHPGLGRFLQLAIQSSSTMSVGVLVHSLHSLVRLGVPHKSRVVQGFLLTCMERLNDFNEKYLDILTKVLDDMEKTAVVNALKTGIWMIITSRITQIQSPNGIQKFVPLLVKDAPISLKLQLLRKALWMSDSFSLTDTHNMLITMKTIDLLYKPLLEVCSKKIHEDLCGIPHHQLKQFLRVYKDLSYKNFKLFKDISDNFSCHFESRTNMEVLTLLFLFDQMRFCPSALMEAFAERVIQSPKTLSLKDTISVVKVYSSLNFDLKEKRQQFLEAVTLALDDHLPKMSTLELMKTVYYFCLLNHFPHEPLKRLLCDGTLETIDTTDAWSQTMLHTISLCINLDQPVLPERLSVPMSLMGKINDGHLFFLGKLEQELHSVIKNQENVSLQAKVLVENFYVIDYVVTKPPLSQTLSADSSCSTEDAPPAEGAKKFAVLYIPQKNVCLGTTHPRGRLAMKIRHLKILGYDPLLVLQNDKQMASLKKQIFPENGI